MKHPDLFGGETEMTKEPMAKETILEKWAKATNYRRAKKGENQCGDCKHIKGFRQSRTWYKCLRLGITGSAATDIRVGHVCDKWEPKEQS